MSSRARIGDRASVIRSVHPLLRSGVRAQGIVTTVCRDRRGRLKWVDESHNIVVNAGLTYLIGTALISVTQITTWYVGLINTGGTVAAADTMASHAGWTEDQGYSEGARQTYTGAAGGAGTVSNSASVATFTITGSNRNIFGVFLTSVSTKGGTTGTLYSGVGFTGGERAVVATDSLQVTYNQSVADDGV